MLKLSRSSSAARRSRSGLGRTEAIWLFVLGAGVAFAILGSLRADRGARDQREARDELRYLAGQLSFALHADAEKGEDWPDSLASQGDLPEGWKDTASMAEVLGASIFLPSDAAGRAYLLRRTGPRTWVLSAATESGAALDLADAAALEAARSSELALDLRLP